MPRTILPDRTTRRKTLPLDFPADSAVLAQIPADFAVWVFSDIHGVLSGLEATLRAGGLINDAGRWAAPAGTALVGLGDYIDRGWDSAGVVDLLSRLTSEATSAGSRVVLVRGNHEQMLFDTIRGDPDWLGPWLSKGGSAYLQSIGWDAEDPAAIDPVAYLRTRQPHLETALAATLPYALWQDVLLVHAGPPPRVKSVEDLARHDVQMWDGAAFLASPGIAKDKVFKAYRAAGITRVVLGHVPQTDGPTVIHDDTVMLVDTNASGRAGGGGRSAFATLVRLGPGPGFDDAQIITIDTSEAPDRARPREGG